MDAKTKINQYRERLDKTLACDYLIDESTIQTVVENRLLQSQENGSKGDIKDLLEKRTNELVNFLSMLRSASVNDDRNPRASGVSNAEWKVKQDNEECRIMYREGPVGTPFHVLLVEGYLDGPVDACLCVTWETTLYKKWWPQFNYPAFKVTSSQCVHQIGIGEQISTVRFKVPWPLSAREALLHYYEFEFFQDDLVVVIIKTIDEMDREGSLYGITNDLLEPKDAVRIGLVGGLVIQKVNNERSYFRSIFSMDMKLDFVPPSLINFIARQLIGNGFKLCQKTVKSIAKGNKDFSKALEGPMYDRIRQAIHSPRRIKVREPGIVETNEGKSIVEEGSLTKSIHVDVECRGLHDSRSDTTLTNPMPNTMDEKSPDVDQKVGSEIVEEEILAQSSASKDSNAIASQFASFKVDKSCNGMKGKRTRPRSEVENALGTLDRVISAVKELHIDQDFTSNADKIGLEVMQHRPLESNSHGP
ncbi:unnamed protein product [Rhodiola kirilowii]